MRKKLLILLMLLLLVGVLAACGDSRYNRLTQWDYHPSYSFILTSVEEQGDHLLLKGYIARNALTPNEVEVARIEGTIEINGKTFAHTNVDTSDFMSNDRLYNASTGTEIFLIPAFFGEFEGDDLRYRMYEPSGQGIVYKTTGMHRKVEVYKNTPVEIWRFVAEPREWGYLELFAPMEVSAHVFLNYTEYDLPDGFPFYGSFLLSFEDGKCVHMRWNR